MAWTILKKYLKKSRMTFDPGRVTACALCRDVVVDNDKTGSRGRQQVYSLVLPGQGMAGVCWHGRSGCVGCTYRETGKRVMNWLDKIPLMVLLPVAVFLALAPFSPEPHLWVEAEDAG